MTGRWLLMLVMVGTSVPALTAQTRVTPYAAATLGAGELGLRPVMQTSPPARARIMSTWFDLLVSGTAGVQIGEHLALDAVLRTTFMNTTPFRAITVGPVVQLGHRVFVRGGLGQVRGSDSVVCVTNGPCAERYTHEWARGFDVSAGVDLHRNGPWQITPIAWWAQSTGKGTLYRSLGVGMQIRFQ